VSLPEGIVSLIMAESVVLSPNGQRRERFFHRDLRSLGYFLGVDISAKMTRTS